MNIYKFYSNGLYIVLDINSGAVHVVDEMVYNIMDIFEKKYHINWYYL